jgi:hypothetical protein
MLDHGLVVRFGIYALTRRASANSRSSAAGRPVGRIESGYPPGPVPHFEVMAVQHLLGSFESRRIVFAFNEGRFVFYVVVACKRKNPIFGHGHSLI